MNYADVDFRDFLVWFYEEGYLEDTFITIMSDHGEHGVTVRIPVIPDDSRHILNVFPIMVHLAKGKIYIFHFYNWFWCR
jgi:arylsulfatase A-like enzyme